MQFQVSSLVICYKISNLIDTLAQCDVTRCVICVSSIMLNITRNRVTKVFQSQRSYIVNLGDLCNAVKKNTGQNSVS